MHKEPATNPSARRPSANVSRLIISAMQSEILTERVTWRRRLLLYEIVSRVSVPWLQ